MRRHEQIAETVVARNAAQTTFADIAVYEWCRRGNHLYQKLPNLNCANAYCMYGGYEYIRPSYPVTPVPAPKIEGRQAPPVNQRRVIELYTDGTYREIAK